MSKTFNQQESITKFASIQVRCSKKEAYDYISSSKELPNWLKKVGSIPGCQRVEELNESYDFVGAKRIVHFQGGDSAQEELLNINYPENYRYKVSDFTNFLNKISGVAQSEIEFVSSHDYTTIQWSYSFQYKSFFSRIAVFFFMTLFYTKFMRKSLERAKQNIERRVKH